jgi:hypothetical protein
VRQEHQDEATSHQDVEISTQLVMGRFMRYSSFGEKILTPKLIHVDGGVLDFSSRVCMAETLLQIIS